AGRLGADPDHGRAELVELPRSVPIGAALRRAAPGPGDVVPTGRKRPARDPGPRVDVGDEEARGERQEIALAAARRGKGQIGDCQAGEMVGRAVVLGDGEIVGEAVEAAHGSSFPVSGGGPYPGAMARYAAFLRGMNLGGRRITNRDLGAAVAGLGFDDVETFRASGNVIFDADGREVEVASRLEAGLGEALGYQVAGFLRDGGEIVAVAGQERFEPAALAASTGKLQVALLLEKPRAKSRREALALATDEDRLAITGRELFWLPSGGMSESELDLNAIAATLGPM